MERQGQIDFAVRVFSSLMKKGVDKQFSFPGGGIARKTMFSCLESLEKIYKSEPGKERILDFCICQVHVASRFDKVYMRKWNVTHSFGKKAMERFMLSTSVRKYHEDKWLSSIGLSRTTLLEEFGDKRDHPLQKFVYPDYEESTKMRLRNIEAGFIVCQLSTLLWTPFSMACLTCIYEKRCRDILSRKFSELYRLRLEEYKKQTGNEWE